MIRDTSKLQLVLINHSNVLDFIHLAHAYSPIFTKVVLTTTETSATTNALNYPLDSAERLLNAAGQMR